MKRTKVNNPVLKGFNPDPSILRVEEDYYIANSTFEYFPGVAIHHSKDLANWETIARPLDTLDHLNMLGNSKSCGIWAPCLSYDNGIYYLIFTDVKSFSVNPFKDCHNYVTTANDIKGPWSIPVYLNSSGFDPSLFHDSDKKWFTNMEWDHRNSPGAPMFSGILLQEFDDTTKTLVGEVKKIFNGTDRGLVEGPHIFKRNGYYYLVTAEGGTFYNHAMTISRSKNVDGPYIVHPNKHLLTCKDRDDLVLQKGGHGSLVETKDGKWYVSFLCGRPLKGLKRCILGRETCIHEVKWENDWPYLSNGTIYPDDVFYIDGEVEIKEDKEKIYNFENKDFLNDFQTLRMPYDDDIFSIDCDGINIRGMESPVSNFRQSLLVRRQQNFVFETQVKLKFQPTSYQHMAGLNYRYDELNQYYLYMSYDENLKSNVLIIFSMDSGKYKYLAKEEIDSNEVYLKIDVSYEKGQFYYSIDGQKFEKIGDEIDTSILSDEYTNPEGFTGAFVGISCQDLQGQKAIANFTNFKYKGKEM